jgi:DNA modification methylase
MAEVELKLGKAQEVLPNCGREFEALFCDPPRQRLYSKDTAYVNISELRDVMDGCWDLLKKNAWIAVWCTPPGRREVERELERMELHYQGEVVWNRTAAPSVREGIEYHHEYVLIYNRVAEPPLAQWPLISIWTEPIRFFTQKHPQAKPVNVCRKVLEWITPVDGASVLDPFAGEGPIMEAAIESGRGYLGAEKEQEWATRAITNSLRAKRRRETVNG